MKIQKEGFAYYRFSFNLMNLAIFEVKIANELWWRTGNDGVRHISIIGLNIVVDQADPSLKAYRLIILGLVFSIGIL